MLSVFEKMVLEAVKKIPKGKVSTYKQIAEFIKKPNSARAVGNALNKNPHIIKIPCHRVVKSTGQIGGYAKGLKIKETLLRKEGIEIRDGKVKDFKGKFDKLTK